MCAKNGRSFGRCFVFLMLINVSAFGQESELNQVGTSMANFLKIGVGARATAMGDAYVALSDDISSLYWNPGGLGTLKTNEVLFQVTDWFLDTQLYFFGISYRLGEMGILGFSINSFSSGDIVETKIGEPDGTGRTFSASDIAAGLTFSRQMTDRFSVGITLKHIFEQLDREKATTVAIDVGSVFTTNFFNDMRIGFALSNLGGRMQLQGSDLTIQYLEEQSIKYARGQLGTEPWDIPLLFRFGVATNVVRTDALRLTVASEVMDSRDFIQRMAAGAELALHDMLFLRGGYKVNYDEVDATFGVGLKVSAPPGIGMKLDYAYDNYGIFDNTQRLSIIIMF